MKKIVLTMVALLSMTAAVAQQSDKKGERKAPKQISPEEVTNRMASDLSLTDKQKTKLLALNKEYQDVLKAPGRHGGPRMHKGPHGPRPDGQTGATQQTRPERPQLTDEQKAQMKQHMEQRKEYDAKLKKILTDEQYKTFQQKHQHGGHGPRPGGHGPKQNSAE